MDASIQLLERVKYIDSESKDCINGYTREIQSLLPDNNAYFIIPRLVTHWILLYYYVWGQFDPQYIADNYISLVP